MDFNTWWQWKLLRLQRRFEEWRRSSRNLWRGVDYGYVMCGECRALLQRGARVCPSCGARQPLRLGGGFGKALGAIGIRELSPNQLLCAFFLVAYLISVVATPGALGLSKILFGPDPRSLARLGSSFTPLVLAGQWWRWITYLFLHGGLLHLGFNSYALMIVGPQVEAFFGRSRFLPLFLICGIVSGAASSLLRMANVVGASGALFGLIGAMIVYGWRQGGTSGEMLRRSFTSWAIYGLVFGFLVPNVDNVAHVAGLATGLVLGFLFAEVRRASEATDRLWNVATAAAVVLTLACFGLAWHFFLITQ
jgi:rhomboid protease GluP